MGKQRTEEAPLKEWAADREHWKTLADYLQVNSGLPGPRGNLELAARFARLYAQQEIPDTAWALLLEWSGTSGEYLPFCAVQAGAAHYGYADAERRSKVAGMLRTAMNDYRWRVREAAAIGMQSIGEYDFRLLQELLNDWRSAANLLEQRAFLAALAHPPLLGRRDQVLYCLELAAEITEGILHGAAEGCEPEHFRVLSKGLEYSLSVFAASEPEAGFALLARLAESGDAWMIRIVKSNLGKSRLSKKYPERVRELLTGLTTL